MSKIIRWGILGAGRIARKFATSLAELPDAQLVAIGSQSAERSAQFAAEFGIRHAFGSYEETVACPEVDVIYVGTRNQLHKPCCILSLNAGKPVLCEKPFTLNATEAAEVIEVARRKGVFLMEAMWTRFFPIIGGLRELLEDKAIGSLRMLQADFGFSTEYNPEGRVFNPSLGGGALLDVGIYVVSLSSMLFGPPLKITSQAEIGETGVDLQCAMTFLHKNNALSVLSCAVRTETRKEAVIYGEQGRIELPSPFWKPAEMLLVDSNGEKQFNLPYPNLGLQFEAAAVMDCLRQGKTEHEWMPLDETLSIMQTLDAVRACWKQD